MDQLGVTTRPQSGNVAVSANVAFGLPFRLRDYKGGLRNTLGKDKPGAAGTSVCTYFFQFRTITRMDYSIFVWELGEKDVQLLSSR